MPVLAESNRTGVARVSTTPVKFYRRSLYEGALLQGATFDGFVHVDDWVPQRLVTATGPDPLPRDRGDPTP
jgi:hypothetical protein